ncbi:MAG: hypothetical protein ABSC23_01745 [Bryobacteraceae bacterium]|jgi:hypothetical protein
MRNIDRALIALLVTAAVAAAQPAGGWTSVKALSSGADVRVSVAKSKTVSGRLESVSDTSLTINPGNGLQSIDREQITQVSVKTKARRMRSMWIGLAVGAGAGAVLGGAAASECSKGICSGHGAALIAGGIGGGALVGALIGAAVSHGGWREIYKQ